MSNTNKPTKKISKPKDDTKNNSNKIIDFFQRGSKIQTTEIVIAVLTGIYLSVIIGLCIYFYISKSFIFEEYIRKEGPSGTVPNTDTKHNVNNN